MTKAACGGLKFYLIDSGFRQESDAFMSKPVSKLVKSMVNGRTPMAMTPEELADRMGRVIERLPTKDLVELVTALGHSEASPKLPEALRYKAWKTVDQARTNPPQLLVLANSILAKAIGWEGAPLLTKEDVRV
jgi:hypothetical protein